MKWVNQDRLKGCCCTSEAINQAVLDAGRIHAWPEATSAMLDKLLEVVTAMADLLPEDKQKELVECVTSEWHPKK